MIRYDCAQGSPEWHALRLGIPTASNFSRILTPGGKLSASADAYMHELIAERMLGVPLNTESADFMERGKALEAQAVSWYELQRDVDTEAVGLCTTDDGRLGASPDRLVGTDGGLEIKCPSPAVHVGYMLDGGISRKYWPQVQGALWITERRYWWTLSYHPDLRPALVRVARNDEYIEALAAAVTAFCDRLDAASALLRATSTAAPSPSGDGAGREGSPAHHKEA